MRSSICFIRMLGELFFILGFGLVFKCLVYIGFNFIRIFIRILCVLFWGNVFVRFRFFRVLDLFVLWGSGGFVKWFEVGVVVRGYRTMG